MQQTTLTFSLPRYCLRIAIMMPNAAGPIIVFFIISSGGTNAKIHKKLTLKNTHNLKLMTPPRWGDQLVQDIHVRANKISFHVSVLFSFCFLATFWWLYM